ncbi:mitochondrial heat shock protein Hsp10 [Sorochytrium milnesiophthora]
MASAAAKRIVPLLDRVLVQRVKAAEKTSSGILIPEKSKETLNEGVVLSTGPGLLNKDGQQMPMSVKTGDRVLLPAFSGQTVKVDQEEFLLYRDSDILAKLVQ